MDWKREGSEDLIRVYKYLKKRSKEDGARLFSVVSMDSTRNDGYKLKYRQSQLNVRKLFYCDGDQVLP